MTGIRSGYAAGVPRCRRAMAIAVMFLLATGGVLAGTAAVGFGQNSQDSDGTSDPLKGSACVARTRDGRIQGTLSSTGASCAYKGIPYAAPPVGELRFRAPAPPTSWSDIRATTAYGPECSANEDCLYLNVWTPRTVVHDAALLDKDDLPVMVLMHPGGHVMGSGAQALYNVIVTPQQNAPPSVVPWFVNFDGQYIAETHHSIVVTINYRYGLLGYLAHESLAAEDPNGSTGNYGLLDQIKALNWVHDNIQHFGGDKGKVGLYGQSVGGMDICSLLTTPLSGTDLFQSAIISSEPGCNRPTKQWVERNVGNVAVANLGCAGASDIPGCLRSLSASQIRSSFAIASPTWRIGSNVDGYALREEPMAAIQGGRYLHMPIMQGGRADEYSSLAGALFAVVGPVSTDDDYQRHIRHWFAVYGGTVADDVLARYPSDTFGPPVVTFIRVMTDALETAVARRVARALANIQSEPVRRFVFTRGLANAPFTSFGAQHGIDLPFAFHNLNITAINGQVYAPTTRELGFADIVSGYWARFIATGDPNGGGTTNWPLYNLASETYFNFGATTSIGDGWRDADCDFWDATVPVPYVYTP
jgi:para-nitrobenzyl esterase